MTTARRLGSLAVLVVVLSFLLAPVLWQVLTSLKTQQQLTSLPPILPSPPVLEHYPALFEGRPFGRYILNSLVVATTTMLLSLALAAPAGFALARLRLPGASLILVAFLTVSMFPQVSIVSSLYLAIRALGLRDTWWALVLADTTYVLPLAVWLLTVFFREVPRDLLRAARVDGATVWQSFVYVALPVAAPGIAAAAILTFVFAWNEFLFALVFTSSPAAQTVPVGIALFPGLHEMPWGEIAAATIVASAPVLGLMLWFQKPIVRGLTSGAVKE